MDEQESPIDQDCKLDIGISWAVKLKTNLFPPLGSEGVATFLSSFNRGFYSVQNTGNGPKMFPLDWVHTELEYELHFSPANPRVTDRTWYEIQPVRTKAVKSSLACNAEVLFLGNFSKIQLPNHFSTYFKVQLLYNGAQDSSFSVCYWLHIAVFLVLLQY